MSIISVNGQSQVPPGFRFHPTEEELLQYYLRKKVAYEKIDLDVIPDVDLNKLEPWDIQEKCKIGSTPQNDWYFFSHKDKKYPTGTRTNRATAAGFWKATGRDKVIYSNSRRIGMRKTLVFYKGRAPHGQKSDWIMHEYRLLDDSNSSDAAAHEIEPSQEEGWVICRTFKKKNHHKTLIDGAPMMMSSTSCTFMDVTAGTRGQRQLGDSAHQIVDDEGTLMEHILEYMGRRSTCRRMEEGEEEEISYGANQAIFPATINSSTTTGVVCDRVFMKLPNLAENPKSSTSHDHHHIPIPINNVQIQLPKPHNNDSSSSSIQLTSQVMNILANNGTDDLHSSVDLHRSHITGGGGLSNWAALDRLVATHLNGQNETSSYRQLSSCFSTTDIADPTNSNSTNGNSTTMVVGLCSPPSDQDLQLQHQLIRSSSNVNQQDYQNECELWSFTNVHHVPI